MPQYLSPGVYVEEVPSAVKPIAGVGTSTAGFIGAIPETITIISWWQVSKEAIGLGDGKAKEFPLANNQVNTAPGSYQIRVDGKPVKVTLKNAEDGKSSKVVFADGPADKATIEGDYLTTTFKPITANKPQLCTNFSEFKNYFGDFSTDPGQNILAHAVYGFFNNGGTRCYVARVAKAETIATALENFEAIDEIAIVAAPGITDDAVRDAIVTHCKVKTQDRFAIFDSPEVVESSDKLVLPPDSDYAAFYYPWIQVFDPATKSQDPESDGRIYVPPSGHMAGIYARVDTNRGVHKAPANEPVLGALGLKYNTSKAQQDGLNWKGVNCIRDLNGNIRVWGARTIGGDRNNEWKYINVRRLFLFLRESIDEGTQWVVFEPNDQALWAKITRNVTAFLTNVWRSGALFGSTPQEAFYVKCDAETNPPDVRNAGQVITEIGVAVVMPAEFVIFRISQWAGPGQ